MRFDTSQHMHLSQQMKLAPRMIQSMEILQMPMLALQERIEQELESNIALEQIEPGADGATDTEAGPASADDWQRLSDLETSYPQAFESEEYSSPSHPAVRSNGERDRKMDAMAN